MLDWKVSTVIYTFLYINQAHEKTYIELIRATISQALTFKKFNLTLTLSDLDVI